MNRLKIAVTKGRLLEDSLDLFEKMGFDCRAVTDGYPEADPAGGELSPGRGPQPRRRTC